MKKSKLIALLVLILLFLSSCNFTSFDTSTILTAPLMNPQDQQIRKAISDAVGGPYEPVYPKTGNYQSAIILTDLSGDKVNDAVCFFKAGTDQNVSFIILKNTQDKWEAMSISKSQALGVDRVSFCELTGDEKKEIIIGWQYLSGEENAFEIFTIEKDNIISSKYTSMYNDFIVSDDCVTVISKNIAAKTSSASLIGNSDGNISIINTVSLNNSIVGFSKIQTCKFDEYTTLIYLDEQLENHTYTTELLSLSRKDKLSLSAINLEGQTNRTKAYTCIDADSDGIIDLPTEVQLPSYNRNGTQENLSYVEWYKITSKELKFIKSTYSSVNEPFYIEIPSKWKNNITIEKNADSERIIHFYTIENKLPMFSIRVFSRQEYTDSTEKEEWKEIAESGENLYTFRNDGKDLPDEYNVTEQIIKKLFVVLS